MARCQQCNKFAGYDDGVEVEYDGVDFDAESGMLTGNIRVALVSECCSDEMKEGNFEVEVDVSEATDLFKEMIPGYGDEDTDIEIEADLDGDCSMTSRTQTEDRNGKRIKNPRYMRTYYGFEFSGTLKLTASVDDLDFEKEIDVQFADDMQASYFEELY